MQSDFQDVILTQDCKKWPIHFSIVFQTNVLGMKENDYFCRKIINK